MLFLVDKSCFKSRIHFYKKYRITCPLEICNLNGDNRSVLSSALARESFHSMLFVKSVNLKMKGG